MLNRSIKQMPTEWPIKTEPGLPNLNWDWLIPLCRFRSWKRKKQILNHCSKKLKTSCQHCKTKSIRWRLIKRIWIPSWAECKAREWYGKHRSPQKRAQSKHNIRSSCHNSNPKFCLFHPSLIVCRMKRQPMTISTPTNESRWNHSTNSLLVSWSRGLPNWLLTSIGFSRKMPILSPNSQRLPQKRGESRISRSWLLSNSKTNSTISKKKLHDSIRL